LFFIGKATNFNIKFNSPLGYIKPQPILKIKQKNSSEVFPQKIDLVRSEDDLIPHDVKQILYSIISNICITTIRYDIVLLVV